MIPPDLTPRAVSLPPKDRPTIVVLTGTELRHDRFALRLQQDFGPLVVGWFQVARRGGHPGGVTPSPPTAHAPVEERLFGDEVRRLRRFASVEPTVVTDPNSAEVVAAVRALDPYFLLSLGGPIYRAPLLQSVRGLALNQHAGWSPEYKGSNTTEWALYHRDLAHVGNTVHLLTPAVDAGPVLRRSAACLVGDDTRESCFARVVALGTELMCEVVADVMRSDTITVYDQPPLAGRTYRGAEFTDEIRQSVDADLERGWLARELSRLQRF